MISIKSTYDLRFKKKRKTLYHKDQLLKELYPSLIQCWVLRKIFKVKGGVGKIKNMDETMSFSYTTSNKQYTHF